MSIALGWTHIFKTPLPAEPAQVFAALTDAAALRRWFAEHVELDPGPLRPGGPFRFWGRYTYGTRDAAGARQRITSIEPGRSLGFEWTFEGQASEVTWSIQPSRDQKGDALTTMQVTHRFASRPAAPYATELVDDFWGFTMGNLAAHLRGGAGIVRLDYTDPKPEVRLSIVIDAPRELVFKALIEPQHLDKWFSKKATIEPHAGGIYSTGHTYEINGRTAVFGPSRILEIVPNERLVLDWLDWRGDTTRAPSRIAWILESEGATKTRVTFIHDGFSRAVDVGDYPFGWAGFLDKLKEAAASL